MRDVAALNKVEMLPWDIQGAQPKLDEQINDERVKSFDQLAALSREPDASFDELRKFYADDTQVLCESLSKQSSGVAIFIAEDERGAALGFIHLKTATDYYTRAEHGHIADIVVAPEGEGRGVGRALMTKGEEWARGRGYGWLTLNVFVKNLHAREVYKRLGYGEEIMRYVKELS